MVGGTTPPQSDSGEISRVLVLNLLWQSKRCSRTAQDISVLTTPSLLSMATKEEPRILAGVNLDGSTYPGMNADVRPIPVHKPFLCFLRPRSTLRVRADLVSTSAATYYVVVTGADHRSFTDAHLVSSRFA